MNLTQDLHVINSTFNKVVFLQSTINKGVTVNLKFLQKYHVFFSIFSSPVILFSYI